jgi:1-acyl-sn-glycerol-3-phosphate acyltransferase
VNGSREVLKGGGYFIISRHIGYIDGLILGGLCPSILLSKKEIKKWPLIGAVVAISGTVFVDRLNKNKFSECLKKMVNLLWGKVNVIVFPEGTSTDGTKIKPFQSVFFEAPLLAKASIIPVSISYKNLDGNSITSANRDDICWYGQISFFEHLWNLFRFRRIEAEVTIHEKITPDVFDDNSFARKKLSQFCYRFLCEVAGVKSDFVNHFDKRDSLLVLSKEIEKL